MFVSQILKSSSNFFFQVIFSLVLCSIPSSCKYCTYPVPAFKGLAQKGGHCHDLWHQIGWLIMWWVRWPVTDLFPCLFMFVYICVWSLDLFWKLYIVLTLRELTSLSQNINFNSPGNSWWSHDLTGGPAHKLSPSQGDLRPLSMPWGPGCYTFTRNIIVAPGCLSPRCQFQSSWRPNLEAVLCCAFPWWEFSPLYGCLNGLDCWPWGAASCFRHSTLELSSMHCCLPQLSWNWWLWTDSNPVILALWMW